MNLPHGLNKKLKEVQLQMMSAASVSVFIGVGLLTVAIF